MLTWSQVSVCYVSEYDLQVRFYCNKIFHTVSTDTDCLLLQHKNIIRIEPDILLNGALTSMLK